jgi:hypothetical protein
VDQLSAWLQEHHHRSLVKVSRYAGGDKVMQCDVFMAAINYLDLEGFLDAFRAVKWETPQCVQLMIKDEHDDVFTIYTPLVK